LQSWKNLFEKPSAAVAAGPRTASQLGSATSTNAGTELVLTQALTLEAPHCNYKVGGLMGKLKVCPSTATFQTRTSNHFDAINFLIGYTERIVFSSLGYCDDERRITCGIAIFTKGSDQAH
jgi:hypothetical protein